MTKDKVKNYIIIMIVSVFLNLGIYYIAHVFHLPMWADNVGSAYAAVALEPTAGLIVAFATNFYQAAFVYDSSSLVYYAVSATAALTFGILLRKNKVVNLKRLPQTMLCYFVIATLLSTLLTLWRTAGVPDSNWEFQFYTMALNNGVPNVFACLFGTAVLKVADTLVMAILIPLFVYLTPKSMKVIELEEVVSLKTPYWQK